MESGNNSVDELIEIAVSRLEQAFDKWYLKPVLIQRVWLMLVFIPWFNKELKKIN